MAKLSLRGAAGVAGGKSKAKAKGGGRRNNAAQKAGYMKALQLYGYAAMHGGGGGGGESSGGESAPGADFDFGANRF